MKYLKTYENFKPIKINSAKPFKVKKNIQKSVLYLQKHLKGLKNMLDNEKNYKRRSEINKDISKKKEKLKNLAIHKLKQAEYLKTNPIIENVDNEQENLDTILSSITEDNFKKVLDYIGIDDTDYEINKTYYDRNFPDGKMYNDIELHLLISHSDLENIMGIENGTINYVQGWSSDYGNCDYYVDDDELNYIYHYLNDETYTKIEKLAKIFDYEIDTSDDDNGEGKIAEFFNYLGLKDVLEDVKSEIAMENERAITRVAHDALKKLPFEIGYSGDYKKDLEIIFEYKEIIEYIKKYNLKVKTFKELLENIYDTDDLNYDIEYSDSKQKYIGDFEDVRKEINDACDKYIDNPDEIFPKLIVIDNLELIQNKKELANFFYVYNGWIKYERVDYRLFEYAKHYNNEIFKWFKSYDFQKWFIEDYENDIAKNPNKYKLLELSEIIDPKIETEYEYLVDVEKYNL
jgi:hypothetical protein